MCRSGIFPGAVPPKHSGVVRPRSRPHTLTRIAGDSTAMACFRPVCGELQISMENQQFATHRVVSGKRRRRIKDRLALSVFHFYTSQPARAQNLTRYA